jgi:hypothetical protein
MGSVDGMFLAANKAQRSEPLRKKMMPGYAAV